MLVKVVELVMVKGRNRGSHCMHPQTTNAEKLLVLFNCFYLTQFLNDGGKFWILNLMTKPNKPYGTTPCLDPSI